jgi:DNA-binding XRE family transcriptional regulator
VRFGKILRINRKTISIRENNDDEGVWKVSASLITLLP